MNLLPNTNEQIIKNFIHIYTSKNIGHNFSLKCLYGFIKSN